MGVAGLDIASKYNEITINCTNTYENANNHQKHEYFYSFYMLNQSSAIPSRRFYTE